MRKTPAEIGPPGCWGRESDLPACPKCSYRKSCAAARREYSTRKTVAAAVSALPVDDAPPCDVDALVSLSRVLYERARGGPVWKGAWDSTAHSLVKAFPSVIAACSAAGWDAAIFVRAQIESLTPLIKKGVPLAPGMFYGVNAQARFERWVARRQQAHGTARIDRTEKRRIAAEKFTAATLVYGYSRCIGGASVKTATKDAVSIWPDWTREKVSAGDRLRALQHILASINSSFPHRIFLPEDGRVPSWTEMRALADALRPVPAGGIFETADHSLGELL